MSHRFDLFPDLGGVILRDFFGVSDFMSRVRREGVVGELSRFGARVMHDLCWISILGTTLAPFPASRCVLIQSKIVHKNPKTWTKLLQFPYYLLDLVPLSYICLSQQLSWRILV